MKAKQYNQPFVSILIPNYNHARFLDQRLQSVLNQTYQNFEVIILDDCSTDNSLEVIEKYRHNPRIREVVMSKHNSGSPFKQWNKGIRLANGDLIWIAESDDYCDKTLLMELVSAFLKYPDTVVAFSSYVQVFDDGSFRMNKIRKNQYYNGKAFVKKWMSMQCVIMNASGAIFSKKAALNVPLTFTEYKGCGDYLFWTQISEQGHVAYVPQNLTSFRIHSDAITPRNYSSGNEAVENAKVFQYINTKYNLSWFQKEKVYAYKTKAYRFGQYDNDEAKKLAHSAWEIGNRNILIGTFLVWSFFKLQKHCGILL